MYYTVRLSIVLYIIISYITYTHDHVSKTGLRSFEPVVDNSCGSSGIPSSL